MNSAPDDPDQRSGQLKQKLKSYGVKLTHQRLVIFDEVAKSIDHPDVETIYNRVVKKIPTVSLDTVYRALWLLNDLGLINTLGTPKGRTRFDANLSPHHHFVCVNCGLTRDFYCDELDELKIPDSVKAFGQVEMTHVEVRGVCLECSTREKQY